MSDPKVTCELDTAELISALKKIRNKVKGAETMKALRKGAEPILTEARRLVPIRTGLLRQSVKIRQRTFREEQYVFVGMNQETAVTGTDEHGGKINPAKYAHLVEFGTVSADEHPFLRPAFDNMQGEAVKRVSVALNQLIEKHR